MKRTMLSGMWLAVFLFGFVASAYCDGKPVKEIKSDAVNVYIPESGVGKLPAVLFSHNGGAKKEDWGDFPPKLAAEGFFTASIGWSAFAGFGDLKQTIEYLMKTYEDKIDTTRVAFVGGCHGGVKMAGLMNETALPFQLKTAVFLSVSENISLPEKHVPILGFYSTNDRLGDYYKSFTKKLVEEIITEPKKAVAWNGTPHGNELVTDQGSQASVQKEIIAWIKKYLAKA
jgi:dienelactone hydrolase